jgi:uncharacterized membrane protein
MKEPSGLRTGETIAIICITYIIGILIGVIVHWQFSVRPLDVYRGKTTLEITYRDSVAIDSTVVYKVK